MPLSDDERRRLEKLEQDLAAADPDLNLKLGAGSCRDAAARTVCGALTVLAGLMVVIAAIITHLPIVGGAGFLVRSWAHTGP